MRYFTVLIFSSLFLACASSKLPPSPPEQIRFGKGGGFSAALTEYCVLNSGKVFKKERGEITKLSCNTQELENCFTACKTIGFHNMDLNQPGNTYTYIEHRTENSIHRATWNPYSPSLDKALVDFHNQLLALVGEPPMVVEPSSSPKSSKKGVLQKLSPIQKKQKKTSPKKQLLEFKKPKKSKQ